MAQTCGGVPQPKLSIPMGKTGFAVVGAMRRLKPGRALTHDMILDKVKRLDGQKQISAPIARSAQSRESVFLGKTESTLYYTYLAMASNQS